MTIKKIVKLQNIGRFSDLAAKGDVQLRKLSLIYGANGHGKTTLAGVLRSLATGDPAFIDERATLGSSQSPRAEILLDDGLATFSAGKWSATSANVEIFDSTFVSENVYTGEHVGPEHRKNLYQVVVGNAAVSLAREIDDADARGRRVSSTISDVEGKLRALIQAPFPIDAFVALVPEQDLDEKIRRATTQLSSVRKEREVLARPQLEPLAAPEMPRRVLEVLGKSVEQVSAQAESSVREHLIKRLDHRGEAWLRQGLDYTEKHDRCPFCAQEISQVNLVALYREYFSTAYREHLVEIEQATNALEQKLGERAFGVFQKHVLENDGRIQGWAEQSDLRYASYASDRMEAARKHLFDLLREALKQKTANPSVATSADASLAAASRDYNQAVDEVSAHNGEIARANETITELKKSAAATNADVIEEELRRLRNIQIRQQPAAAGLVDELAAAKREKKAIEESKNTKKTDLARMAEAVLGKYEASINRLLDTFGANFTITGTKPSFAGGKASSTYRIAIDSIALDLGDASTPRGKPCFRTALSTGDKSTLALAFFLARLEHDAAIGERCVVFDDPLSSFDCFRTSCTQQELLTVAAKAGQTIVLSHDSFFLKRLFDASREQQMTCLQVVREPTSYSLKEWKIAEYFLKEAHQEYFQLRAFIEDGVPVGGDLTSVARAIRPYLEGHFRHRYPEALGPTEYVGDVIAKIRTAQPGAALHSMKAKLNELEKIVEYANPFHHASTPAPRPNDSELRTYVKRSLAFVQG